MLLNPFLILSMLQHTEDRSLRSAYAQKRQWSSFKLVAVQKNVSDGLGPLYGAPVISYGTFAKTSNLHRAWLADSCLQISALSLVYSGVKCDANHRIYHIYVASAVSLM
ncbi:hypothetical protein FIBSPDRAFT_875120, partial [Athelia psychrophila]